MRLIKSTIIERCLRCATRSSVLEQKGGIIVNIFKSKFDCRYACNSSQTVGRSSFEIAVRVASLQLFLSRWGIECAVAQNGKDDKISAAFDGINRAIELAKFKDNFSNNEKQLLIKPLGSWTVNERYEQSNMWETFGILHWSLQLTDNIPEYSQNYSRAQLFQQTKILPGNPETIMQFCESQSFSLQPIERFHQSMAIAELWLWRAKAQKLLNLNKSTSLFAPKASLNQQAQDDDDDEGEIHSLPENIEKIISQLPELIKRAVTQANKQGLIPLVVDDDFGVNCEPMQRRGTTNQVAYKHLDDDLVDMMNDVAESRLFGFAWISNSSLVWDDRIDAHLSYFDDSRFSSIISEARFNSNSQ